MIDFRRLCGCGHMQHGMWMTWAARLSCRRCCEGGQRSAEYGHSLEGLITVNLDKQRSTHR